MATPLLIPLEDFLFYGNNFDNPNLNVLFQLSNFDNQNNNYHIIILSNKGENRNDEIINRLLIHNIRPNTIINNVNGLNNRLLSPLLQPIENRNFRNEVIYIRDNDNDILNRL